MTKELRIGVVLGLLLIGVTCRAIDPTKPFSAYVHHSWNSGRGLPEQTIYDIVQTRDGFIWLATAEGPVRFDGLRFKLLELTPQLHSAHSVALLETSDGALWFAFYGPGGGLVRYANSTSKLFSVVNNLFSGLMQDKQGRIWVGTEKGLFVMVPGEKQFAQYSLGNQFSQKITSLAVGPDGAIWAATDREVLAIRPAATPSVQLAATIPNPRKLYFDDQGTLWIGTDHNGLYTLGQQLIHQSARELNDAPISTIFQDKNRVLWIGSLGKGLCRLRSKVDCYTQADGLSGNQVSTLYEDREGSLWVGTFLTGLNRLNDGNFRAHAIHSSEAQYVWSIDRGRDDSVWAGTNVGLQHLKDGSTTEFNLGEAVTATSEALDGAIWVGTPHGLKKFKNGRVIRTYTTSDGLPSDKINALHEDENGSLWIGTLASDGGLTRLRNGVFTRFTTMDGLASTRIHTITEDDRHALWFGTSLGVTRLEDNHFTNYPLQGPDGKNDVNCIYVAPTGDLWLGTDGAGLVEMHNGAMTFFTKADGLPDDTIWSVLDDDHGSLWMTSNRGLFQLRTDDLNQFATHELKSIPYVSYGTEDGLITSEFNGGYQSAAVKTSDGRMWFASIQGIVEFDRRQLARNNVVPPIAIEKASLDNQALQSGSQINAGVGNLEFNFAALSFLAPERIQYKYRLEGFDSDWISVGNRNTAYYTNVPPGTYQFHVIASNNDGVWNSEGTSFGVVLKPRYYQTWTFRILCGILLLAAPFAITGIRHRARQRMERLLEQLIAERSVELTRAKEVAEAAAATKTNLLANISHELRTPMNGLLGMLELMRAGGLTEEQRDLSEAATYSGNALLNTVNQILAFSELEAKKLSIGSDEFDFPSSMQSVRHVFTGPAHAKNIELGFQISAEIPKRMIGDPNRFVQVIFNLVGNAIKFTDVGSVNITANVLRQKATDVEIQVCVADTGIGIHPDYQKQIFEPFCQVDSSLSRKFGGTGLGLSIAKELINLMGGRIWVESEPGKGSKFFFTVTLCLPKEEPTQIEHPQTSVVTAAKAAELPSAVLVVEDNIINQKVAASILRKQGCKVTVAENGRDALDKMSHSSFDLVLMDIQMPVMNGIEATLEIRRHERETLRHMPIVAITAHASAEDRQRCLEAGMDEYLSKPVGTKSLIATITEVYKRCGSREQIAHVSTAS